MSALRTHCSGCPAAGCFSACRRFAAVVREVPLEPLVCARGKAAALLNPRKKCRIVQHSPPKGRQRDAFAIAKLLCLLQQVIDERGLMLSAHAIINDGLIRHRQAESSFKADGAGDGTIRPMSIKGFLDRVDEARNELRPALSRRAVARAAGLSDNYFSDLPKQRDRTRSPKASTAQDIANVLQVNVVWLLSGEGPKHPGPTTSKYFNLPPAYRSAVDALIDRLHNATATPERPNDDISPD